jgi:cobalamin biosynthesis protein CobD/CbiB
LVISFLISSFRQLEIILTFDLLSHFLIFLAMVILVLSGKIFLQEVERMLRHREEGKKLLEKYAKRD